MTEIIGVSGYPAKSVQWFPPFIPFSSCDILAQEENAVRICYFGTYEKHYPRNRMFIDGLRMNDADVEEYHYPVLEKHRHKAGSFLTGRSLAGTSLKYPAAYGKLVMKLIGDADFDAFLAGYMGHPDMVFLKTVLSLSHRPFIFNPMISLYGAFTEDRGLIGRSDFRACLLKALDVIACRSSDAVVLDTLAHARYFAEEFSLPPDRLKVIYVGADDRIFRPREARARRKNGRVLFYGKFSPIHGIEYIRKAAEFLSDEDIEFTVIGSGQKDFGSAGKNVTLIPWVAYERLPSYINDSDLCLGLFSDLDKADRVIPNKVFQACACGVPVITSETTAIKEIFTDGEDIMLCRKADAEDLAEKIADALNNREKSGEISVRAMNLVKRNHTVRRQGEQLTKLIRDLEC